MTNPLNHIAIIMDGNARWAKKNNKPTIYGHKKGAQTLKDTIINCCNLNLKYLTIYAFSTQNWQRSDEEVENLLKLLQYYLENQSDDLILKHKIKIKIIGNLEKLSDKIKNSINKIEENTQDNNGLYLTIAFSYGGQEEIIDAVKKITLDVKNNLVNINDIDVNLFSKYLYNPQVPNPDLLIRTGGDLRISNFLLFQIAYSELFFSEVLWPDFNQDHLKQAINCYNKTNRKYGKR